MALFGSPTAAVAGAADSGLYADFLTSRFAQSQSDPADAAGAALNALALDPGNPVLLSQAFFTTALAGRPEALGLAHMLPNEPFADLMIADMALQRGDLTEAARAAERLPSDGVMQALRPLLLAWIDQERHSTDAALHPLKALLQDGGFRAAIALHAGMIADLAGREQEAARFFSQAEAAYVPLGLRPADIIASFYARTGHQAEALAILGRGAEADAEMTLVLPALSERLMHPPITSARAAIAEAYLASAGTLREQGQNDLASLLLRDAISLRPDFTSAKLLLADIDRSEGRLDAARDLLTSISPHDPLLPIAQLHWARLMHQQADDAGALDLLGELAVECPQSALPLTERAEILRSDGQLAEAASTYNLAITHSGGSGPSTWFLFYERAMLRDRMNDWPAAEADLRRALTLAPDQPYVLNYLGYSWADRGEHLLEAARMIARADAADPNDGAIVDSMGWVMLKQGDIAGAVRTLERATELMPSDPSINGHLGDAYAAAGRKLEARYQWERALTLRPDPSEAAHLRLELEGSVRQSARAQITG